MGWFERRSVSEETSPPHWYAGGRCGLHVPDLRIRHSFSCPSSGSWKKNVYPVRALFSSSESCLNLYLRGKCIKNLFACKSLFPFSFAVFFAQVEVETRIDLKDTEAVMKGKAAAVIIEYLSYERGPHVVFAVVVHHSRAGEEVDAELIACVLYFTCFHTYIGTFICHRRVQRQTGEAIACEHPVVSISDVETGVAVFYPCHPHIGIHVLLHKVGEATVVEVEFVFGERETRDKRACVPALVGRLAEGCGIRELAVVEYIIT